MQFSLETFVCSVKGHCAPAHDVVELGLEAGDALEGGDLGFDDGGRRYARCLRCDAWLMGEIPKSGDDGVRDRLGPLTELDLPRRGRKLRDAVVLRFIAVQRAAHVVLFGLAAILLWFLFTDLPVFRNAVKDWLGALTTIVGTTGQSASRSFVARELAKFGDLRTETVLTLAITSTVYAVIEGVEAVGLWYEKRWAEYLTVLATAGFLPFEIHELLRRVTFLRVAALVLNVAILIYLVWSKRLFGLRAKLED